MSKPRTAFAELKRAATERDEVDRLLSDDYDPRTEEKTNSRTLELQHGKGVVRAGAKKVGLVLPAAMHQALLIRAAKENCRLSALVEGVLRAYLGREEF